VGQKVNPIGFRLGVIRSWESKWVSRKYYAKWLHEDILLRRYIRKHLERADMAHQPFGLRRRAHARRGDVDEYPLTMPQVGGGCEVVMTRALSRVRGGRLRRLAESHLWQYASWQRPPHGSLVGEYATKYHADAQAMYLDLFSRYDHPVARVAILRSVPWIIENQSADGSWGAGELRDATTLAVVRALARVKYDLPAGFLGVG